MKPPNTKERDEMRAVKQRVDELMRINPGEPPLTLESVCEAIFAEFATRYEASEIHDIWQTGRKIGRGR